MDKFNDIFLKAKSISQKQKKGYRVYSDKTNFSIVEADTAQEAIEKSGGKAPYKIEPVGIVDKSIFTQAELTEVVPQKEQPVNNAPANPPSSISSTAPAEAPVANQPAGQ